jgi:hypothetical protein
LSTKPAYQRLATKLDLSEAVMGDERERERLNEGLRLLRAFFRIADRDQRQFVVDLTERAASLSPVRRGSTAGKLRLASEEQPG